MKLNVKDFFDLFKVAKLRNPFTAPTKSHGGKHAASKRGHVHKRGMSRGQRKDAQKVSAVPMHRDYISSPKPFDK
jgi:hypothetical protein